MDGAEAVWWFRLAADQGFGEHRNRARSNLGAMYAKENGDGVPEDDVEAVRWYRLAADDGYAGAQNALGWMYHNGNGVPQDYVQAHMWLHLAASRLTGEDREKAVEGGASVAQLMTPAQIAEAQRLAREWDAAHPREP
jgi:TPR repeat protein